MTCLKTFAFAACFALAASAGTASATPITWTLHDVTFDDGGTATGTFDYDADTNTVSAVDITTSAGTSFPGADYTLVDPGYGPFAGAMVFVTGTFADYTGTPALSFVFASDLTDAGGTVAAEVFGGEFTCIDSGCTNGDEVRAMLDGGSVTAAGMVPEPATLSLLAAGGLLGFRLRRSRKAS